MTALEDVDRVNLHYDEEKRVVVFGHPVGVHHDSSTAISASSKFVAEDNGRAAQVDAQPSRSAVPTQSN